MALLMVVDLDFDGEVFFCVWVIGLSGPLALTAVLYLQWQSFLVGPALVDGGDSLWAAESKAQKLKVKS